MKGNQRLPPVRAPSRGSGACARRNRAAKPELEERRPTLGRLVAHG